MTTFVFAAWYKTSVATPAKRMHQGEFCAVGIKARQNVKSLFVQQHGYFGIMSKLLKQIRRGVQCGGAGRVFLGVNVCVNVIGGFLEVRTCGFVGDGQRPDVLAQKGLADAD